MSASIRPSEVAASLPNDEIREQFMRHAREVTRSETSVREAIAELAACADERLVQDVNREISTHSSSLRDAVQQLEAFAYRLPQSEHCESVLDIVAAHEEEMNDLKASWREANIAARRNIGKEHVRQRSLLLDDSADGVQRRKARSKQDELDAARRLTESLASTHRMLAEQLDITKESSRVLDESSATIGQSYGESKRFEATAGVSHSLITRLKRRDTTDKLLVLFALLLLVLVILYILKVRVGSRISWWLSWLPTA